MSSFGQYDSWPRSFGGDDNVFETIHNGLLEEYGKVWDVTEGTIHEAEAYAEACVLECIDAAAERLRGQRIPNRMFEALPKWEEACRTRPGEQDTRRERVAALTAKLRGIGPNAEPDISQACEAMLGEHFVGITYASGTDEITYYPGVNPGPPGWEWSTNIEVVNVQVRRLGLNDDQFLRMTGALVRMLDAFLPSWMTGSWYTHDTIGGSSGFFLDYSLLDLTGL